MQRRQFLQSLSCAASVPALAQAVAMAAMTPPPGGLRPAVPHWLTDPFALGVASGEPRTDSVLLWTRLYPGAPRPGESATDHEQTTHFEDKSGLGAQHSCIVSYEIYDNEALKKPVRKGEFVTHAARAWSVHARINGLRPDRHYWYRFRCGNAVSPVGRTRTAPALDANVARLRLALASCQHYEQGRYVAHVDMARQDLDLVLFVGDYIYESTNPKYRLREHTGGVPKTLEAYRERHALYKSDADLRSCHAAHPWVCTWDDHEVDNDYAADQDRAYTQPGVFLARRAAAYQAYFEHMPVWPGGPGGAYQRIHQHWQWGQLVDMWTLDCRQFRSAQPCRDPLRGGGRVVLACDERDDPARTMLGAEQEAWLTQGMRAASGRWRVLAQGTQISSTGVDTPLGRTIYTDGWDGYTAARGRLLGMASESGAQNVLTLGGDVHQNVAANLRVVPNDPASPVVASEFVTTSVTSRGLSPAALDRIRASNPDIAHARSDERGYTLIDITPKQALATFRTTPFPAQAGASLGVQARYVVAHGRAGVEPA